MKTLVFVSAVLALTLTTGFTCSKNAPEQAAQPAAAPAEQAQMAQPATPATEGTSATTPAVSGTTEGAAAAQPAAAPAPAEKK